jgi:flagellar capping protein FliD
MDGNLIVSIVAVVAAGANSVILLMIKLNISQLDLRLREWARQTFADQEQIDRRFRQIEEAMHNIQEEMARIWSGLDRLK